MSTISYQITTSMLFIHGQLGYSHDDRGLSYLVTPSMPLLSVIHESFSMQLHLRWLVIDRKI